MSDLTLFTDVYSIDKFDKSPLPVNIYNSTGAILAYEGQSLPKDRLRNTYILADQVDYDVQVDKINDELSNFDTSKIDDVLHDAEDFLQGIDLDDPDEVEVTMDFDSEEIGREIVIEEASEIRTAEDNANDIEAKLDRIEFNAIDEVKVGLHKNIYQTATMFQSSVVNEASKLVSKDNEKIATSIYNFLNTILNKNLYAADYMDMMNAIRDENNYIRFSHASSVAFYSLSIAKKLRMIQQDLFVENNIGKWIPVQTKSYNRDNDIFMVSNQILRYTDLQKNIIRIKYSKEIAPILYENVNDILHQYSKIDTSKPYPSMKINFNDENIKMITMAALNHDIGKLFIPDSIINKKEKLTRKEFLFMQKHPSISVRKLQEVGVNNPRMFAYILGHHRLHPERGYPPTKKMPPYESKILAIADIYDAMRAPTHYSGRLTQKESLDHIRELYEEGCFDLPLYLAAIHTFQEYNHEYIKKRSKVQLAFE